MRISQWSKRTFAGLAMALAVTTMAAVPVRAEDPVNTVNQGNTSTDVQVTCTVQGEYMLEVPKSLQEISYGTVATGLSIVVRGNIGTNEHVQVVVKDGELRTEDNKTLAYTIMGGDDFGRFTKFTWYKNQVSAGESKTAVLNIPKEAWDQAAGGTYTGHVVFTAKLVNENDGS